MMNGRNNGKKIMAVRIVQHAFEIIHLVTEQNPIQVLGASTSSLALYQLMISFFPIVLSLTSMAPIRLLSSMNAASALRSSCLPCARSSLSQSTLSSTPDLEKIPPVSVPRGLSVVRPSMFLPSGG